MPLFNRRKSNDQFVAQASELHHALMQPLFESLGLNYGSEHQAPSRSIEGVAGLSLKSGFSLFVQLADPDAFPSSKRSDRFRGAEILVERAYSELGREAVIFLAHAMPHFLKSRLKAHAKYELGEPGRYNPEREDFAIRALQQCFPVRGERFEVLEELSLGFDSLALREAPPEELPYVATRLAMDLKGPLDPAEDHVRVEAQMRHASAWFIVGAHIEAIEIAMGEEIDEFLGNLADPTLLNYETTAEDLYRRLADLSVWSSVGAEHMDRLNAFATPDGYSVS